MENKVCVTAFIYGDRYQDYIPMLAYSINKVNPEYKLILFLHEKLRSDIKELLIRVNLYQNILFVEDTFSDCKNMTPLVSASLRWILWDDSFGDFDYLYYVDIDMLYCKETLPLHEQHIRHMDFIGLPFSNVRRPGIVRSFHRIGLLRRIKYAGFNRFFWFLSKNNTIEYRASGLHFVKIKEYFSKLSSEKRSYYKYLIYSGKMFSKVCLVDNEAFLYWMLSDMGYNVENMGVQSSLENMLDFNNYMCKEFRPHHGIHLGIFRIENIPSDDIILNSKAYKYYYKAYAEYKDDAVFNTILSYSSKNIQLHFERLDRMINIIEKNG